MNETWWVNAGQLDNDQKQVLKADPKANLLIKGPPGSGKTNILLLRANYVRATAPRLLFITFTRTLTEFIRSGPSIGRADQIQKEEILTFMSWGIKFLSERGHHFANPKGGFLQSRSALIEALNTYIKSENPGKMYDSVFIDEVQDFRASEIEILRRLSITINGAGDSRQAIWEQNEGLPAMAKVASQTVLLVRHYRIGLKICNLADRILPPPAGAPLMADDCAYDEQTRPSDIKRIPTSSDSEQFQRCLTELKQQIRYISDEPILVLARTNKAVSGFWNALEQDGGLTSKSVLQSVEGYEAFDDKSLIRVMTIHSAKGSEARAVHILQAEKLKTGLRELAFTAVTRAKTEVFLYHTGPLPGQLETPGDESPEIDNLF